MPTVAVIGASPDRTKYANKAVRAFAQTGHTVYPVHPAFKEVEGHACFPRITDLPAKPDIVSVYLGPPRLLPLLPGIAERGCGELWLNPGTSSSEVEAEARKLGLKFIHTCSILAVGKSPLEL